MSIKDAPSEMLSKMTDLELQRLFGRLAGPILRELARRNYTIRYDAMAYALRDGDEVSDCFDFKSATRA